MFLSFAVVHTFLTCYSAPIVAAYLLLVLLSRHLTKLFSPFDLHTVLLIHNLLCSLISLYTLVCFLIGFWQVLGS